jgi:hypothetical protein
MILIEFLLTLGTGWLLGCATVLISFWSFVKGREFRKEGEKR